MNRLQKKELRQRQTTRQLMGISQLTEHGAKTAGGELVFFMIRPDNLSVLSSEGIRGRVKSLTDLLCGTQEVRMLALDSRESFQRNKDWYRQRLEQEELPAIRELLRQDAAHLDEIQSATASAREFALVYRLGPQESGEDISRLRQTERSLRDLGFRARLASEQDIKRLLAVYYQQDVTTESFENCDGERWVKEDGYWQASGESLKTSIRTKTRLGQIVQEGRFRGGTPAYGYQLVKKGRTGKKNRELYDIEINPDEAFAVKRMFDLTDRYGYGGRKISTILKSEGIVNLRTGEPFHYSTIQHILANIMNAGILRSGETQSEVFPELQIIPLEQFQRVAKAREQRSVNYAIKCGWEPETITLADGSEATVVRSTGTYPRKIVGKALLSGNVYCGHCGGRIFATTARKAHHPSEHPERIAIYKCYNRTQHKEQCDGPTTYRAEKVDGVVESILRGIFERAKRVDEQEFLKAQVQLSSKQYQQKLKLAKAEYSKATKELSKWEELMLASIEGTCVFTPEQVKKRMDIVQEKVDGLAKEIEKLQIDMSEAKTLSAEILAQHQQLLSWAELFDSASIDEKKLISSQMIKAVTLTRNYGIQIEFNISEAQFLNGMEMG